MGRIAQAFARRFGRPDRQLQIISADEISAERGDLQNEFIEITEGEANQIVDRIRATVTGASNS